MNTHEPANLDPKTVEGFGREWATYTQKDLDPNEHRRMFDLYFRDFPFNSLSPGAEGFDLGCGSGRWAELVLERVGRLHCIDASAEALAVARDRLGHNPRAVFHLASVDSIPLRDGSQDFGYSLGVLHHVPDTLAAIRACVAKLKPGGLFLIYIYYRFDNRGPCFRSLWRLSDLVRRVISRTSFPVRSAVATAIAAAVYWPLARGAAVMEKSFSLDVDSFPLSTYRRSSFYTMRTDSLDRFGTRLERRFTQREIHAMMVDAGLTEIVFRRDTPYWVALGRRKLVGRTDRGGPTG